MPWLKRLSQAANHNHMSACSNGGIVLGARVLLRFVRTGEAKRPEKRLQEGNGGKVSVANVFSGNCMKFVVVIMQTSRNITMALTINLM